MVVVSAAAAHLTALRRDGEREGATRSDVALVCTGRRV